MNPSAPVSQTAATSSGVSPPPARGAWIMGWSNPSRCVRAVWNGIPYLQRVPAHLMRYSRTLAGIGTLGTHTAASHRCGVLSLPLVPTNCDVPHRACCSDIPNTLILRLQDDPVK